MNYDDLPWQPSCCGEHRSARVALPDEELVIQERPDGMVYLAAFTGVAYNRDSQRVPSGQAVVTRDEAGAIVAAI